MAGDDEGTSTLVTYYKDSDGDSFGDQSFFVVQAYAASPG